MRGPGQSLCDDLDQVQYLRESQRYARGRELNGRHVKQTLDENLEHLEQMYIEVRTHTTGNMIESVMYCCG